MQLQRQNILTTESFFSNDQESQHLLQREQNKYQINCFQNPLNSGKRHGFSSVFIVLWTRQIQGKSTDRLFCKQFLIDSSIPHFWQTAQTHFSNIVFAVLSSLTFCQTTRTHFPKQFLFVVLSSLKFCQTTQTHFSKNNCYYFQFIGPSSNSGKQRGLNFSRSPKTVEAEILKWSNPAAFPLSSPS